MDIDIASEILHASRRLSALDPPSDDLDEPARAVADAAVEGVILVRCLGEHRLPLGRANIDWFDPRFHTDASIVRFGFLNPLAAAYRILGDERYAERDE